MLQKTIGSKRYFPGGLAKNNFEISHLEVVPPVRIEIMAGISVNNGEKKRPKYDDAKQMQGGQGLVMDSRRVPTRAGVLSRLLQMTNSHAPCAV